MQFDIITIFPEIFNSYFKESLLFRAQEKKLIKIKIHNLRDYTTDKHQTVDPVKSRKAGSPKAKFNRVDDRPFGGGFGMVLKIEPIFRAINALKKSKIPSTKSQTNPKIQNSKSKTILFTPRGKKFNQKMAYQLSKNNQIILICGRYEGFDERVAKLADMELSIGDYDLMGGELPAMIVIETIARLIPGVISKPALLKERIPVARGRSGRGFIEYPQYTRPEVFSCGKRKKWRVPKVLLSGNHKKIEEWRKKHGKIILS